MIEYKHVTRTGPVLRPDQTRVLLRPFVPGDMHRARSIVSRVLALNEEEAGSVFRQVCSEFAHRHANVERQLYLRYEQIRDALKLTADLTKERQLLIGSYFLAEYSLESAALCNPSIVPHPDQSSLPAGAVRFILSLRAVGEGHISSITFRTGIVHHDGRVEVFDAAGFLTEPAQIPNTIYEKPLFLRKLAELGYKGDLTERAVGRLNDEFTLDELRESLAEERTRPPDQVTQSDYNQMHGIWLLAKSNYEVQFQPKQHLAERILFPVTPAQSNGIEDARFVYFQDGDSRPVYYATYTAYDGRVAMPELVETADFLRFRFITLNGPAARNKGMALFPRKINGHYAMISRQDNENIFLMYSDNVHFWNEYSVLLKPLEGWELVQMGNCGSPIETEAGWLVLSHGVGPMRKYCIGAFLLDRENPTKVIGRLKEPLLVPNRSERTGYVPNVVYTCGAMVHHGNLVLPYGISDYATGFASVPLRGLLRKMLQTSS